MSNHQNILDKVRVRFPVKDQEDFLTKQLLAAADKLPAAVKDTVKDDLRNGLRLSKFVPHPNVTDEEIVKSLVEGQGHTCSLPHPCESVPDRQRERKIKSASKKNSPANMRV